MLLVILLLFFQLFFPLSIVCMKLKIEYLNSQLSLEAQETESSLLWYFDSISSQLKKQKIIDDDYNLELLKENMENEIENSNYMFIKNMEYIIVGRKY